MKSLAYSLALFLIMGFAAGQSAKKTVADSQAMDHYVASASEPKKVFYYDTGHDLNDPKASEDGYDWLAKPIDLKRFRIPV